MRALLRQGEPAAGAEIIDLTPADDTMSFGHTGQSTSLHDVYAEDWLTTGGIRANFVSSVDGAVSVAGLSRGLQTHGDNRVFAAIRDLADVVVVGAATAAAERYRQPSISPARAAIRKQFGTPAVLGVALISRSLKIDTGMPLLQQDAAIPPTVFTCTAAGTAQGRKELSERVKIIDCGDDDVDLAQVRDVLAERGLTRVVCEGGPTLLGALAAVGLVDELCLSVSPLLVGPGPDRISKGTPWPDNQTTSLTLHTVLEEDGALFYRYRTENQRESAQQSAR